MKLMGEMLQPLMFTPEERKVADEAIQQFVQILTEAMNLNDNRKRELLSLKISMILSNSGVLLSFKK